MRTLAIAVALSFASLSPLAVELRVAAAEVGATASASVAATEQGIRECANHNRRVRGIAPLAAGIPLNRARRLHAANMARRGFFDHTDPEGRGPAERVGIFDRGDRFSFIGENISAGYDSVAAACRGWMRSSGHRRNILDADYTHIGGGFARGGPYGRYYVQVFAGARL